MNNTNIYRYPGPTPFQDTPMDKLLFHGRGHEKGALLHMVLAERLVVLYAKSGLGKTSLINAGLLTPLREKNFIPFRITFTDIEKEPLQALYLKIEDTVKKYNIDYKPGEEHTLWQFFKTVEFWSSKNILLTPVLVLDQFEEIFTLHSGDHRKIFFTQLADLIRGRIPKSVLNQFKSDERFPYSEKAPFVKVIISIREDFLGQLEEMSQEIPDILHKRFRLQVLNREQAMEAIIEPANVEDAEIQTTKFSYSSEAVEAILDFLCKRKEKDKVIMTDEVEPFQLQVICQNIESKVLKRSKSEGPDIIVQKSDLGGEEGMQRVLKDFYIDKINKIGSFWVKSRVRKLFQNRLISDTDRRLSLEEEQIERKAKVSKRILIRLVSSRLLRAEPRVGSTYYELSHDTLIKPIRKARRERRRKHLLIAGLLFLSVIAAYPLYIPLGEEYYKEYYYDYSLDKEINMLLKELEEYDEIQSSDDIIKKSKILQEKYDDEKSIVKKDQIEKQSAKSDLLIEELAYTYSKKGKYEEAFDVYESASQKKNAPEYLWSDFLTMLTIDKDTDEVENILDIASTFNSNDPKYYYNLGEEFFWIDNHDKEVESYMKAIELDPEYIEAYHDLGNSYYYEGKYDEAIKYYEKVIEIDPDYVEVYYDLGDMFYYQENYDEAIKYYEKVIEIDPYYLEAYYTLGYIFYDQQKYDEAIKYYEKVIEIDPDYGYAYYDLGVIYYDKKFDYIKAYEMFEKAYSSSTYDDISTRANLAEASLGAGYFDKAYTLAKEVLNYEDLPVYLRLAMENVSISSLLLLDKRSEAYSQLRDLALYLKSINEDFSQTWYYNGFKNFISKTNKLDKPDKELIVRLIEILESPKPEADKKLENLEASYPEIFKQMYSHHGRREPIRQAILNVINKVT